MNLHQFYFHVWLSAKNNRWRIGQALFNELLNVWPERAEILRGSVMDPFFSSSPTDARYDAAIRYLESVWFSEPDSPFNAVKG